MNSLALLLGVLLDVLEESKQHFRRNVNRKAFPVRMEKEISGRIPRGILNSESLGEYLGEFIEKLHRGLQYESNQA